MDKGESDISYLIGFAICDYYYFDSSIKLLLSTKVIAARGEDNHQLLPFKVYVLYILQSDMKTNKSTFHFFKLQTEFVLLPSIIHEGLF